MRAAAAGTVAFEGQVGVMHAVTILHDNGFSTTYSFLRETLVEKGSYVTQGQWIGRQACCTTTPRGCTSASRWRARTSTLPRC